VGNRYYAKAYVAIALWVLTASLAPNATGPAAAAAGTESTYVVDTGEQIDVAGMAQAEDFIAYDDGWGLRLAGLDGRRWATLETAGRNPVFSPDGTRIAYRVNSLMPTDVSQAPNTGAVGWFGARWDLYIMKVDGSRKIRLSDGEHDAAFNSFSPDSRRIAYTQAEGDKRAVYVVNVDGTGRARLVDADGSNYDAAFSYDGGRVAFTMEEGGQGEIYVISLDGGELARITVNKRDDTGPVWSPDGTKIAFYSRRGDGRGVYVINAGGTGERCLVRGGETPEVFSFTRDGSAVLFNLDEFPIRLCVVKLDGSDVKVVDDLVNSGPTLSPDGGTITYTSEWAGEYQLYLYSLFPGRSGEGEVLGPDGWCPCWNPSFSPRRVDGVLYDTYGKVIEEK